MKILAVFLIILIISCTSFAGIKGTMLRKKGIQTHNRPLHARNLLGEEGYKKLLDEIEGKPRDGCGTSESKPVEIREPGADCQDLPLFRSKT
jgi:hypothetical protein